MITSYQVQGAVKIIVVLVKKKKIFVEVVILGKAGEYFLDGRIFDCIHEITVALAFARMTDSSAYRVETTSRLAQWKIDNLASCTYRKSDPFKIGKHLSVEKNRVLFVKLYPEISNLTRENPPIASFIIRVVSSAGDRKALTHPEVTDKQLKNNDDFVWAIDVPLTTGKFIIDVEFLDLKAASPGGGEPCSIWDEETTEKRANATALVSLGRMLTESIHTDIKIIVSDGSIGAHRAVLAARSPVFHSMFAHDLKEKELSTINISDMSIEACQAFLNYIYGNIQREEFLVHRLALLSAADKYDIADLKEACHDSLLEDIDTKNVLERLQSASLYQLPKLKTSCLRWDLKTGYTREEVCRGGNLLHLWSQNHFTFMPLTFATQKSYVVYLGSHSHGLEPTQSDIERVTDSHYELLGSFSEGYAYILEEFFSFVCLLLLLILLQSSLDSKEKAKEKIFYSYTNNINGFAAVLEEEEASSLAKHPDVVSVFLNKGKKLHTTRSWNFLGLEADGMVPPYSLWKKARYGEDVIIGNLDTGVWPESKSFSDEGMGPVPSKWRGICQHDTKDGVVCNRKLIGTRYFNKGYAAYAGHLNSSFQTARDSEGHGTHTLSTAAGNFVPGADVLGYGNGTAKGGSPHARAAAYKVCWPPINGSNECFDADILAAFDVAISDGVDVLSVSLGGDPTEFSDDAIAIGSFHAVAKGITVVASAGNSGPSPGTVSNVAPWLITVGASTMDRAFTIYVALGNRKHLKGASLSDKRLPAEKFYPLISAADAKAADQSEEDALLCKPGALDPKKVKGKILVCLRGENGRVDKGHQALIAGAVGMILANDENSGNEIIADTHVLPAAHVNFTDGEAVFSYLNRSKDNNGEPILDSTNTKATPFADGAGHVQPNLAADPGLIYDLTVNDFLNFLCSRGNTKKDIKLFSDKPYTCPKSFSLADFNYPSITVTNLNDSITVTRRVRNVGSPGTYNIHIRAPPGVTVSVAPSILRFRKAGEEKMFKVTFKRAPKAVLTDYVFGMLTWKDDGTLDPNKVSGKIILCLRGQSPRLPKGYEAERAGAVGMILANDIISGDELYLEAYELPSAHITYVDGESVMEYIKATRNPTASISPAITSFGEKPSPAMAKFSSRGPTKTSKNKKRMLDYDGQLATPFMYGAGHVQPNLAADPGLVYDTNVNDYLSFLCAHGYNKTLLNAFSDGPYTCPENFSLADFNYPSITVPDLKGPVTVTRRVKNVGAPGTYTVSIKAPAKVSVAVEPSSLEFKQAGEEQLFKLTFKPIMDGMPKDYEFGHLTWSDGLHRVKSPLSYIVYMGESSFSPLSSTGESSFSELDVQKMTQSHFDLLGSCLESKENVQDVMIYSYTNCLNGFAAYLNEAQVAAMKGNPGVISVFENQERILHTTHSWEFIGFEANGAPTPNSLQKKANFGEGVIIANLDTGKILSMKLQGKNLNYVHIGSLPTVIPSYIFWLRNITIGVWPESKSFNDEGMGPVPSRWKGTCQAGGGFKCNNLLVQGTSTKVLLLQVLLQSLQSGTLPVTPRATGSSAASKSLPAGKFYPLINAAEARLPTASSADAQLCQNGTLDPKKVAGKIIVCLRGINSRVVKGHEAELAGAVGMILANDEESGSELLSDPHVLPAAQLTFTDGQAVMEYIKSTKNPTASISPVHTDLRVVPNPVMAAFSSRGPSLIEPAILKPDVTAPGVDRILDAGGQPATPFAYGAGHVNPNLAADPGLVYDTNVIDYLNFLCARGYNSTFIIEFSGVPYKCPENASLAEFNYPSITVPDLNGPVTVTRRVKNVGAPGTYTVKVKAPPKVSVVVEPSSLEFKKAGEEKIFKVTFKPVVNGMPKDYTFGHLTWSDSNGHRVKSPLVVCLISYLHEIARRLPGKSYYAFEGLAARKPPASISPGNTDLGVNSNPAMAKFSSRRPNSIEPAILHETARICCKTTAQSLPFAKFYARRFSRILQPLLTSWFKLNFIKIKE
ncbi:hypothetical protein NC653_004648 [Populus alba x Populus x berolinensis]|uniref:BTB domain-containing protein n=1 Tax=Populus alba x Populus x berolinensis TaxID=444605 RepID=A0AAD6RUG9_9ROSI|nr:hypothetical protein NC653_004648 [Populus alba x Populus x berolinensis]